MKERKTFATEKDALDWARSVEETITKHRAQTDVPNDKLVMAENYSKILDRLSPYSKTPEDAADFYLAHLGKEATRQSKPSVAELVDKWKESKLTSKIKPIGKRMVGEVKFYARFLRNTWGGLKIEDVTHQMVEDVLNKLPAKNRNTHRKYLRFIRMFFIWAKHKRHLRQENPTDGILIKSEDFTAKFYDSEKVCQLLRHVATSEKDLVGMYALLTFAGLRPSEGARVEWEDIDFETHEIYVKKGKREERRFILEAPAKETLFAWLRWHRDNTPKDQPFVALRNLGNRERKVRKAVLNGEWVQDGLRHGFATYYNALTQDPYKVCYVTGDIIKTVKRHYMRAVKKKVCDAFWGLTPAVVLADEQGKNGVAPSGAPAPAVSPDNPDNSTAVIKTSDCVIKNASVQIASPAKKTKMHYVPVATGDDALP
ncbi:MAG TPA: site-specific integrase [Candidatus Paceibacterota bacterium]|nr:site-specific integrase [Verrucomicrobiota bacterium]HSA09830.1 site-specific integrase [Candidatus Paceibacterota bacterium]